MGTDRWGRAGPRLHPQRRRWHRGRSRGRRISVPAAAPAHAGVVPRHSRPADNRQPARRPGIESGIHGADLRLHRHVVHRHGRRRRQGTAKRRASRAHRRAAKPRRGGSVCRKRLDAPACVRQRLHGDDRGRGREQRGTTLPDAHDSQRAARADHDHLAPRVAARRHCVSDTCVRHRRHRSRTARLPERDLDARRRRGRPRRVLLPDYRVGGRRARALSEHELCGFSASVSRPGRGPVPPRFVRDSRPPPRVLAGHHRPGRAVGLAVDRVRRHYRSAHPALRDRGSRGVHHVAGGNGRALAARGRPPGAPLAPDQPGGRGHDRNRCGCRRDCQVLRGRLDRCRDPAVDGDVVLARPRALRPGCRTGCRQQPARPQCRSRADRGRRCAVVEQDDPPRAAICHARVARRLRSPDQSRDGQDEGSHERVGEACRSASPGGEADAAEARRADVNVSPVLSAAGRVRARAARQKSHARHRGGDSRSDRFPVVSRAAPQSTWNHSPGALAAARRPARHRRQHAASAPRLMMSVADASLTSATRHTPVHRGERFDRNALTPSRKSALP